MKSHRTFYTMIGLAALLLIFAVLLAACASAQWPSRRWRSLVRMCHLAIAARK